MTKQIELIVPLRFIDGKRVAKKEFDRLEYILVHLYGGITKYPVKGQWKEGEKVYSDYSDDSIKYVVTTKSKNAKRALLEVARYIKKIWKQQAVYLAISNVEVDFI